MIGNGDKTHDSLRKNKLTGKCVEGEEHKYVHDKDSKQENPQIAY